VGARGYIFTRSGAVWTQQKIIRGGNGSTGIGSAAIALNGNTLLAGSPSESNTCGKAFVQTGSGSSWISQGTGLAQGCSPLINSSATSNFGEAVAVENGTVVVGGPNEYSNSGSVGGRVYVFTHQPSGWTVQQQLVQPKNTSGDGNYGQAVAISGDTVAVGAPGHYFNSSPAGAVYVFVRSGSTWTLQAEFDSNTSYENFGAALALRGNTLLVGGPHYNNGGNGAAYVYTRTGTTWSAPTTLVASDGTAYAQFGIAAALDEAGTTALIGANYDQHGGTGIYHGAAYVFKYSAGNWTQQPKIIAPDTPSGYGENFGTAVAISGTNLAIGASAFQVVAGTTGQVYTYALVGGVWTYQSTLYGSSTYNFGASVGMDGISMAVGSPQGDQASSYGGVYFFQLSGGVWNLTDNIFQPNLSANSPTSDNFGYSIAVNGAYTMIGGTQVSGIAPYGRPSQGAAFSYSTASASTTSITTVTPSPAVVGQSYAVSGSVTGATPTGTVTVSDGTVTSPSCTLNGSAAFTCNLASTSAGSKTLTATYAGDVNNAQSSGTHAQTINKAATTLSISAHTPNPSTAGTAVAVTVTFAVASPGAGSPTGSITVSDSVNNCMITLPANSCNITLNTVGTRMLTASYPGDANFLTITSAAVSQTVNSAAAAPTTTTISTVTPTPAVVGQSYAVSGTVTSGSGTPTGTVTVSDGSVTSPQCTLASGAFTCNLASTSAGSKTLTATYAGNSSFATSNGTHAQTINKASTTTTLTTVTTNPSVVGQSYTASGSVTATAPGSGIPAGTVTVSDGIVTSPSCTLNGSGAYTCTLASTSAGSKTLTATYAGNANYLTSNGTHAQTINKASTTTTLTTVTSNPSVVGQSYTASGSVAAVAPGAGVPAGTVTVSDGMVTSPSCTLNGSGAYTCTLASTSAGNKTLTATYAGNANYLTSNATHAQTINKAATTLTISGHTPNPSNPGQAVAVTISLNVSAPGAGTPSGSVTISDSISAATCTVTLPAASCNITLTAVAAHTLTATYGGDNNFTGSTSTGVSQTVQTVTGLDLAIAVSDSHIYRHQGDPVNYVIVASSIGTLGATGAAVKDTFPAQLSGVSWSCSASGTGAACGAASGTGNINTTVNLPVNTSATFFVTATVAVNGGTIVNTATITAPVSMTDNNSFNNSATDTDYIVIFHDGFDGASAPSSARITDFGSGAQEVAVIADAATASVVPVLFDLVDANGRARAELTQAYVAADNVVVFIWLQRDDADLWMPIVRRALPDGEAAKIGWHVVVGSDGAQAAGGLTIDR